MATDDHHVGLSFGNPGRNGAYPNFGDELYGYSRLGICVLQIEDKLGEVFYRINIMVRGRRNKHHAGH